LEERGRKKASVRGGRGEIGWRYKREGKKVEQIPEG